MALASASLQRLRITYFEFCVILKLSFEQKAGTAQSVYRPDKGWKVRGSNPGGDETFRIRPDQLRGPPRLLYNGYWVSLPGGKAAGA